MVLTVTSDKSFMSWRKHFKHSCCVWKCDCHSASPANQLKKQIKDSNTEGYILSSPSSGQSTVMLWFVGDIRWPKAIKTITPINPSHPSSSKKLMNFLQVSQPIGHITFKTACTPFSKYCQVTFRGFSLFSHIFSIFLDTQVGCVEAIARLPSFLKLMMSPLFSWL